MGGEALYRLDPATVLQRPDVVVGPAAIEPDGQQTDLIGAVTVQIAEVIGRAVNAVADLDGWDEGVEEADRAVAAAEAAGVLVIRFREHRRLEPDVAFRTRAVEVALVHAATACAARFALLAIVVGGAVALGRDPPAVGHAHHDEVGGIFEKAIVLLDAFDEGAAIGDLINGVVDDLAD